MVEFDVSGAIARVYDLAEPGSPVFVDGVQLVFALCGWHYLRDYADRYGSTQAARCMLVHEMCIRDRHYVSRCAGKRRTDYRFG